MTAITVKKTNGIILQAFAFFFCWARSHYATGKKAQAAQYQAPAPSESTLSKSECAFINTNGVCQPARASPAKSLLLRD